MNKQTYEESKAENRQARRIKAAFNKELRRIFGPKVNYSQFGATANRASRRAGK